MKVVALTGNGLDAVRSCLETKPDIVVMDQAMPEMNRALKPAEMLRRRRSSTPGSHAIDTFGHRLVHDHDVGLCFEATAHSVKAIAGESDHLHVALRIDKRSQAFGDNRVVVARTIRIVTPGPVQ